MGKLRAVLPLLVGKREGGALNKRRRKLRQHVEARLRVVDILLELLKREQAYRLLLQFVEPALAPLAGRLEYFDHATYYGP